MTDRLNYVGTFVHSTRMHTCTSPSPLVPEDVFHDGPVGFLHPVRTHTSSSVICTLFVMATGGEVFVFVWRRVGVAKWLVDV